MKRLKCTNSLCTGKQFYVSKFFLLNDQGELINPVRKKDIEIKLNGLEEDVYITCAKCDSPNVIIEGDE